MFIMSLSIVLSRFAGHWVNSSSKKTCLYFQTCPTRSRLQIKTRLKKTCLKMTRPFQNCFLDQFLKLYIKLCFFFENFYSSNPMLNCKIAVWIFEDFSRSFIYLEIAINWHTQTQRKSTVSHTKFLGSAYKMEGIYFFSIFFSVLAPTF